jgi:hypothetical protein
MPSLDAVTTVLRIHQITAKAAALSMQATRFSEGNQYFRQSTRNSPHIHRWQL